MNKMTRAMLTLAVGLACPVLVQAGGILPADVSLETVIPAGQLSAPLAARHAGDDSGRLFVVEQGGAIRILDNTGTLLATPFINLSGRLVSGGERGLLGLDFHPDYANNGLFYVNYSAGNASPFPDGTTVVSEFQVSADPNIADATSERVLLTVRQDFSNHNGGDIHFGPDGYLYIGMGDGGSGGDPCNRSRTLDPDDRLTAGACLDDITVALLGKMLRIDVDTTTPAGSNELCGAAADGSAPYGIPADNPFNGADPDSACDEVWAFGLRNPFRFSFDRVLGDMLIADVGQGTWEEVDFEPLETPGGLDYGWSICEGSFLQGSQNNDCTTGVLPVLEYLHTGGRCSIEGGYRYRGPVTSLNGLYSYGDFCTGEVWLGQEGSPGSWTSEVVFNLMNSSLTAFGEDQQGNVYIVTRNEGLLRFAGDEVFILVDGFEDPEI